MSALEVFARRRCPFRSGNLLRSGLSHQSFYRKRCLVCEQPMERRAENQLICGKRKCRNALDARAGFGRFYHSSTDTASRVIPSKTPGFIDSKTAPKPDRPWHIVVGEISANAFHCATVPDGSNGQWKGGEYERVEAKNRAALKAAEQAGQANGQFTEPEWREVISPEGVRCLVTRFRKPQMAAKTECKPAAQIADDLTIPSFLDRRPTAEPLAA
jgi:hypothetical protein